MSSRLALFIGSECASLPTLGFPTILATSMRDAFTSTGAWQPATLAGGLLLDPDLPSLRDALTAAFQAAHRSRATLLIAFVGHGVTTGDNDFHLMTTDSPEHPDSETAFNLVSGIRDRIKAFTGIDGLIVLIDACTAGEGIQGAATRWLDLLSGWGRLELLVSSSDSPAFAGCFSTTLLRVARTGVASAGEHLLCANLRPIIADECMRQIPELLSFASGSSGTVGDPGLWVVPNAARASDAVAGLPMAGLVDQLTRGLIVTDTLRATVSRVIDAGTARLRLVVGPAGIGKSTLMSVLVRPSMVDTSDVTENYVSAAAFLDNSTTLDTFAETVSSQLDRRYRSFGLVRAKILDEITEAERRTVDGFEVAVLRPLAALHTPGRRIRILIDGLDQPQSGSRDAILSAIARIVGNDQLGHVDVIASARAGYEIEERDEMRSATLIDLGAPSVEEIQRALQVLRPAMDSAALAAKLAPDLDDPANGWLKTRLVTELPVAEHPTEISLGSLVNARLSGAIAESEHLERTLAILTTLIIAGVGPAIPLELVARCIRPVGDVSQAQIRNDLVTLGALVVRGRPGLDTEHAGISHSELVLALTSDSRIGEAGITNGHRQIAIAIDEILNEEEGAPKHVLDYIYSAGPRHMLMAGLGASSLNLIRLQDDPRRPADNRERWATWLPTLEEVLGATEWLVTVARAAVARWTGEAGDPAGAALELESVVSRVSESLGADHPETFAARNNLAYWRGEAGDLTRAESDFAQIVDDEKRSLGSDHPYSLTSRSHLARWRGHRGDAVGALKICDDIFQDHMRLHGPDHPLSLVARGHLARWRGESGDAAGAAEAFRVLAEDQRRVVGADHPQALAATGHYGRWRGLSGDPIGAMHVFDGLLRERERVLGERHPDTLATRNHVGHWRGRSGDASGALATFRDLVDDQTEVMGRRHPHTLASRSQFAYWLREMGFLNEAANVGAALVADQLVVLGDANPMTLQTREFLASTFAALGDGTRSAAAFSDLVDTYSTFAGHPDSQRQSSYAHRAYWTGMSGNPTGACAEFDELSRNLADLFGRADERTLAVRAQLAFWLEVSGKRNDALNVFSDLELDMAHVLGYDHAETLKVRGHIVRLRANSQLEDRDNGE